MPVILNSIVLNGIEVYRRFGSIIERCSLQINNDMYLHVFLSFNKLDKDFTDKHGEYQQSSLQE